MEMHEICPAAICVVRTHYIFWVEKIIIKIQPVLIFKFTVILTCKIIQPG